MIKQGYFSKLQNVYAHNQGRSLIRNVRLYNFNISNEMYYLGKLGFEPRSREPESRVLPLNYFPDNKVYSIFIQNAIFAANEHRATNKALEV